VNRQQTGSAYPDLSKTGDLVLRDDETTAPAGDPAVADTVTFADADDRILTNSSGRLGPSEACEMDENHH
jgi:hypothetical protein